MDADGGFSLQDEDAVPGAEPGCGASRTGATSDTVPPYYAETIAIQPPAYDSPLNVSIRDTATGQESAALRALPPYQSIGFVAGTGKPNWWIAGAQPWHPVNYDNSAQPAKLYLATMEATTVDGNPMNQFMLTALPAAPMRASQLIDGTAESSDVRQLAAATVSPDGKRLALVITQGDAYQVSVYPVTGAAMEGPGPPAQPGRPHRAVHRLVTHGGPSVLDSNREGGLGGSWRGGNAAGCAGQVRRCAGGRDDGERLRHPPGR